MKKLDEIGIGGKGEEGWGCKSNKICNGRVGTKTQLTLVVDDKINF